MNHYKIGEFVTDASKLKRRDCFHVAAMLVKSTDTMTPGQSLIIDSFGNARRVAESETRNAIADPFAGVIIPETLFWALIEPKLVSGVQHEFTIEGVQSATIRVETEDADDFETKSSGVDCLGCYS